MPDPRIFSIEDKSIPPYAVAALLEASLESASTSILTFRNGELSVPVLCALVNTLKPNGANHETDTFVPLAILLPPGPILDELITCEVSHPVSNLWFLGQPTPRPPTSTAPL